MITSKQRAILKSLSTKEQTILHVGKKEIDDKIIKQAIDALSKRELIKGSVLETSSLNVKEVAEVIANKTDSEVVFTIGSKFVLYKRNKKNQKILI